MSVEEIVLSLPEAVPGSEVENPSVAKQPKSGNDELICRYQQMLKERRRFAWTRHARQRREQAFDAACKSLAKKLARESTVRVEDRLIRLEVRNRMYADVSGLLGIAATELQRSAVQTGLAVRYLLLFGILGTASLAGLIYFSLGPDISL